MKRAIVFDFDETLSRTHLFAILVGWKEITKSTEDWDTSSQDIAQKIRAKFEEISLKHQKLRNLKKKMKHLFRKTPTLDNTNVMSEISDEICQLERQRKPKQTIESLYGAESFSNWIFGGEDRVEKLRAFFEKLQQDGADLYISSKGFVSAMIQVLKNLNLLHFFKHIHGNDDQYARGIVYPPIDKCMVKHKGIFLQLLSPEYEEIIFVDDDPSAEKFIQGIYNAKFMKVQPRAGINENHMQHIQNVY